MIRFILIFLFLISNAYADSEVTTSGHTGADHIIQSGGTSLRPRPYLNFTGGITCSDTGGKTVCSGSGSGGSVNWSDINNIPYTGWTKSGSNVFLTATSDSVGVGTTLPASKLEVVGGGIGAELVNKGYEYIIPQPVAISGTNVEVGSFLVDKGILYIGYRGEQGTQSAKLYKWNGNTLTSLYSFGTGVHFQAVCFIVKYGANMYAGIEGGSSGDGDVYVSTDDGVTWSKSYDSSNDFFMWTGTVFKGKLYTGAGYSASRIYSYDGSSWTNVYSGLSGAGLVMSLTVSKGRLFAALASSAGATVSAILSSVDGTTWVTEASYAAATYNQINNIKEFRGKTYAVVTPGGSGTNDLLVRNDTAGTWSVSASAITAGNQCHPMEVYNDKFYIGCTVTGGGVIYKTDDGTTFTSDFVNNGAGAHGTEPFKMVNYDGSLYIGFGFASTTTGDIFRKTDSLGQMVDSSDRFIKMIRFNTNNSYPYGNDPSLVSLSTPISFDTNVGIGVAPTVPLQINGTSQSVYVTSSGNIGVGTSTPQWSIDTTGNIRIDGASLPAMTFGSDFKNFMVPSARTNGDLNFYANTTQKFSIPFSSTQSGVFQNGNLIVNNGNNLGIGTGQPQKTLCVGTTCPGSIDSAGAMIGVGITNSGSYTQTGTSINNFTGNVGISSASPGQKLDVQGTVRALYFSGDGSALTGVGTASGWTTDSSTKTTTTYNVGIGSTNPGKSLDVQGTVRMTGFAMSNGAGSTKVLTSDSSGNGTWATTGSSSAAGGTNAVQYNSGSSTFAGNEALFSFNGSNVGIGTTNAGQLLDVLGTVRILSNGNLGIGTNTPGQLLDVNGGIRSIASGVSYFNGNLGIGSLTPGQALDVQGTVRISLIGRTLSIVQGSNACAGQSTLSSGTITVSTTCTPANSKGIILTDAGGGTLANIGSISVGTVSASVSFVINSSNALDSSNVNWEIHGIS